MKFKKLVVEIYMKMDIWEKTLRELGELNDWMHRYGSDAFVDIYSAIESHKDLIEKYEHCKEVIEHHQDKDIANIPFLDIYNYEIGIAVEWRIINTEDDDNGSIKEKLIEGVKYDWFDIFYLIEVPLTDSVKTQLDNFRWIKIGYNGIVLDTIVQLQNTMNVF